MTPPPVALYVTAFLTKEVEELTLRFSGLSLSRYEYLKDSLRSLNLHTVCEEAQCPNIGEARPLS